MDHRIRYGHLLTSFKLFAIGQQNIAWPGLHRAISITLYNGKPYDTIWVFQPLGTGTAILLAAIITALLVRLPPKAFFGCIGETIRQCWLAVVTVMLIVGLAYLMNYSGLAYTLGRALRPLESFSSCCRRFSDGPRSCCPEATRLATPCLETFKSLRRVSSISIPCYLPRPIHPAALWVRSFRLRTSQPEFR